MFWGNTTCLSHPIPTFFSFRPYPLPNQVVGVANAMAQQQLLEVEAQAMAKAHPKAERWGSSP